MTNGGNKIKLMKLKGAALQVSVIFLILTLPGCVTRPQQMTRGGVDNLIAEAGYVSIAQVAAGLPVLRVQRSVSDRSGERLRVYLEGDGLSWRTRRQLSAQPSPVNPLALRLMLADPSPDTAYIARPCQFVQDESCALRLWSTARFSVDIIRAVSATLDQLKIDYQCQELELVGYSGGAAVALLVAAQRHDVQRVITVCGNLDHETFCRLHHVSPLFESLNPVNFVDALQGIEQLHFIGGRDEVVPQDVFAAYRASFPSTTKNIAEVVVAEADHHSGWIERWPELLAREPR